MKVVESFIFSFYNYFSRMRHVSYSHNSLFGIRLFFRLLLGLRFNSRTGVSPYLPQWWPPAQLPLDLPKAVHPDDVGPATPGASSRPGWSWPRYHLLPAPSKRATRDLWKEKSYA